MRIGLVAFMYVEQTGEASATDGPIFLTVHLGRVQILSEGISFTAANIALRTLPGLSI
jgi:hypothetical protein